MTGALTTIITITAPAEWLNSNQRHKRRPDGITKAWRDAAHLLVKQHARGRRIPTPVAITAELCFPDNRRRDAGNYYPTIKAAIDGLVDAQLIADDSDRHVSALTIKRGPTVPAPGRLILTITEVTR